MHHSGSSQVGGDSAASSPSEAVISTLKAFSDTTPTRQSRSPTSPQHTSNSSSSSSSLSENWDKFQERVLTYVATNGSTVWLLKPLSLSPTVCAQYGWMCVGADLLKCVTCSAILDAKLPKPWKDKVYHECLTELVKCLKTSHHKHCPWPLVPSPDHFVWLVPIHKSHAWDDFLSCLETLLILGPSLPVVNENVLKEMFHDEELRQLCHLAGVANDDVSKCAIALASVGWKKGSTKNHEKQRYIVCERCHREIGVWFYNSLSEPHHTDQVQDVCDESTSIEEPVPPNQKCENSSSDKSESSEPLKKRLKLCQEKQDIDPLGEHRHWCPWVIPAKDKAAGDKSTVSATGEPGWKIFLQCLKRNLRSTSVTITSPQNQVVNKQKLMRARLLLESWTSEIVHTDKTKEN